MNFLPLTPPQVRPTGNMPASFGEISFHVILLQDEWTIDHASPYKDDTTLPVRHEIIWVAHVSHMSYV